jgi:hypothetical protein
MGAMLDILDCRRKLVWSDRVLPSAQSFLPASALMTKRHGPTTPQRRPQADSHDGFFGPPGLVFVAFTLDNSTITGREYSCAPPRLFTPSGALCDPKPRSGCVAAL